MGGYLSNDLKIINKKLYILSKIGQFLIKICSNYLILCYDIGENFKSNAILILK